jgi:amino acid transporter
MNSSSQKMGLTSLILLGINGIIGSGIFLLPGKVAALASSSSLFVYLFVILLVLAIAWCFAQCAALFNRNGGAYVYAKEAFGDFIGFEIGLMRWVVGIMAWAALIVGFVTALSSFWPAALLEPMRSILILGLIGALGFCNLWGVKMMRYLNNIVTVAKLLPLVFFVAVGAFYMKQVDFSSPFLQGAEEESFGAAALMIFYAFGGFESLAVAAGDMKNPTKHLPIAIMIVITFCSALYFFIQMIATGLLGPALIGNATPLADAADYLLGSGGKWMVTLAMLISIGGVNITASFIIPRSGMALAEDGMLPRWLAHKESSGVPTVILMITLALAAMIALSANFSQLVAISVVSRFAQYISTCLAVIVLYRRKQIVQSPFKKALNIIAPLLSLSGIGWLLLQTTYSQLYWGLGALVVGVPLYLMQKKGRHSIQADEQAEPLLDKAAA